MAADNFDPVIVDLNPDGDSVTEMESLCLNCYEQGMTRLMLTRIPFFREVIISSFQCPHCQHSDTSIQSGGTIQEKGIRFTLKVTDAKDLNRSVIKSDYAVIAIPELEFEQPASRKGEINTVEGLIESVIGGLLLLQEERRKVDPDVASKIDDFIEKLKQLNSLEKPFTLVLDDPTGNSFVENPNAPNTDELLTEVHYMRSHKQDILVGCCAEDDEEAVPEVKKKDAIKSLQDEQSQPNWNFKEEVMTFQTNCPNCMIPCVTNMKVVDIPYFKQVVIMATVCDACGHRDNEVKGGTGVEQKGRKITLVVAKKEDLNRDVLKSDTAGVKIPELDFEMVEGSLGGRFTTIEGLVTQIRDQLSEKNPFLRGDSSYDNTKSRVHSFCQKLNQFICGEMLNVHLILDDPAGNSYIQSLTAPEPDPQLMTEDYERSYEQNEELGLNDMKTENYGESIDGADSVAR